jgi:hypothetical protein
MRAAVWNASRVPGQEVPAMFSQWRGHGLTGPVEVHGARPGDVLAVRFVSMRPDDWAGRARPGGIPEFTGPFKIRASTMTCGYYRTSSPVTALPMIMR